MTFLTTQYKGWARELREGPGPASHSKNESVN